MVEFDDGFGARVRGRRTRRRRARVWLSVVRGGAVGVVLVMAGACSGSQSVPVPSFGSPVPGTVPPGTVVSTATSSVVASTSTTATVIATSTTSTVPSSTVDPVVSASVPPASLVEADFNVGTTPNGTPGLMFSPALGVRVPTAPGVNTQGDTRQLLPEGLYVHIASSPDPNDASILNPLPEDIEILEAYANASLAYYVAFLGPLTTDAEEFATYYVDAGAKYDKNFAEARAGGFIGSLGNGVVLRPYILRNDPTSTSAVVLDCYLQNEQYLLAGEAPTLGPLTIKGSIMTMTKTSGQWQVDIASTEPAACL